MPDREYFVEGVQIYESGEEEYYAEGVQFNEDQAEEAPAGGLPIGSLSLLGCGL